MKISPTSFKEHLFTHIWNYKIQQELFNSYYQNSQAEDNFAYDPEEFYAGQVASLLSRLKSNFPLQETFQKIVEYLDEPERSVIIDFMSWYNTHHEDDFLTIFAEENHGDGYNSAPLKRLVDFVKSPPKPWAPQEEEKLEEVVDYIVKTLRNFTPIASSVTKRRKGKENETIRLSDEYDIQDLLHVMLKPQFPLIRTENVVDGKTDRQFLKIDFTIPDSNIAIECKYAKHDTSMPEIKKQMHDDIIIYSNHPDCKTLIFFIYNKDFNISDPIPYEKFYSTNSSFGEHKVKLHLIISPK